MVMDSDRKMGSYEQPSHDRFILSHCLGFETEKNEIQLLSDFEKL